MKIREITGNDIPSCAETFVASYNEAPWNCGWKLDDAIKYLGEYLDSTQFKGFLIDDDGHVPGAIFGHSRTWWTSSQFMIDELFIAPGKQGNGYGKKLLTQAEQFAKDHNIGLLTLMTNRFMPALHFYNNNDFTKVDQYIFMFKHL
jgi:aminoglycoside 6'-N-acetyltransferase I